MSREFLVSRLYEHFAGSGLRMTRQRKSILEAVRNLAPNHFDVNDVLAWLDEKDNGGKLFGRATVYRTLELFVECGILRKLQLEERAAVFELIPGAGHHEHLVCTACGKTIEFISPEIERLQDEICREKGFKPKSHILRISGTCSDCLSARVKK